MSGASVDDRKAEFLRSLGAALIAWQHIEHSLADVFVAASSAQIDGVALAIFYSPHDFSQKLDMTHNAIREIMLYSASANVSDDFLREWAVLRKRMITESEFRNAIAHFAMGEVTDEVGPTRYALMPKIHDPTERYKRKDRRKKKLDPLDTEAMSEIEARFTALSLSINDFLKRLAPYIRQLAAPFPA